jgi:hypothetical protein
MAMPTPDSDVARSEGQFDPPLAHPNGSSPSNHPPPQRDCEGTASWSGVKSGLPPAWPRGRTAPWRQTVQRRRITLLNELARLERCGAPHAACAYFVDDLLEDANVASCAKVNFLKWWWGTEVERAWARLREVQERIVELVPDNELPVYATHAAQRGHAHLDAHDPRLQHLEELRQHADVSDPSRSRDELRCAIVAVLRASHGITDCANREARFLRNRLLIASAFCVLFAAAIVGVQSQLEAVKFMEQTAGWPGSGWSYLGVVMLFGAVGSLFTAIPAVSNIPSNFGPFNLPLQQGLLKIAFGPLVAVIGLAVLSSEIVPVTPPETLSSLLLMAVVLGAGQHAVTRYVDQRAEQILTAATPGGSHSDKHKG